MKKSESNISTKSVACSGAVVGAAATFAYSMVVMLYAITRTSSSIYSIMPDGERTTVLLANGFSLAYSIAVFSLLMALPSATAGIVTGIILKKSLLRFNPLFNYRKAMFISCAMALTLLAILFASLYSLLGDRMTFDYPETFLFWFLFPAIISFIICLIAGIKMNNILNFSHHGLH